MRYTLGIFHLAINPTGFNQSQWEIKKQRSQIVQDWIDNSGYFCMDHSGIDNFRRELLDLILKLKKSYNWFSSQKSQTDNKDSCSTHCNKG